jgi:hypothetical protein
MMDVINVKLTVLWTMELIATRSSQYGEIYISSKAKGD